MQPPVVLFEDNHLLVVNKPTGLATAGVVDSSESDNWASVYAWAGEYIKVRYGKPGNVFVGVVSRLDTMTSGVLVLAKTSKAASRLSEQIRHQQFNKNYLAVVEGHLVGQVGEVWVDQMFKDDAAHRMRTVMPLNNDRADGKHGGGKPSRDQRVQEARLEINSIKHFSVGTEAASIISVRLLTGRKHQIRVQFAARGHAVWGDRKYGAHTPELRSDGGVKASKPIPHKTRSNNFSPGKHNANFGRGIALHASSLSLIHPTLKEQLTISAPLPETWKRFGKIEM